jgi:hypothetical protein
VSLGSCPSKSAAEGGDGDGKGAEDGEKTTDISVDALDGVTGSLGSVKPATEEPVLPVS